MKSVGEVMAIGRTFKESLQKALRSLEIGLAGLDDLKTPPGDEELKHNLRLPNALRVLYIKQALKNGYSIEQINQMTQIDLWFLENIRQIVEMEARIKSELMFDGEKKSSELLRAAKEYGFSDLQIARLLNRAEADVRKARAQLGIKPDYKLVDTCAAEFAAFTPYYYSSYG